jgi:hypothetical protein
MKRTPLKRKTPLARGKKGLRRTRLKPMSDKQRKENARYLKLNRAYLLEHPKCEACREIGWELGDLQRSCEPRKSTQVHHKMGRGKHLCAVEFFCASCDECHTYIEANKNWARSVGLILYK